MTLEELKKKVLALIEEIDTTQTNFTNDPDIEAKLPYVINQVIFELARMKKIPAKETMQVTEGVALDLNEDLDNFYQLNHIKGVKVEIIDNFITFKEEGTADIYYYKYPTRITETTANTFKLELSDDALEIAVYGIAGDLLKADVSNAYGNVYMQRYQQMKQELDPRYAMGTIYIEGGLEV
jgi:hypothetical protein